jgi:WD40 repeat protein
VHTLYGSQAWPLARIIQGTPTSWNPTIATRKFPAKVNAAAWSPCAKFIAISWGVSSHKLEILDATTLGKQYVLHLPDQRITWQSIIFSPDSHLLTAYSYWQNCVVNWDLQTGGPISNIVTKERSFLLSISYSGCGTMIGGLFDNKTIITYNILSGECISSHSFQQYIVKTVWTHGECLQFATIDPESIGIWEISFISSCVLSVYPRQLFFKETCAIFGYFQICLYSSGESFGVGCPKPQSSPRFYVSGGSKRDVLFS